MAIRNPAVLLYDANGNPLAVQDDVDPPAGTSGLLIAGMDGTTARFPQVAPDDEDTNRLAVTSIATDADGNTVDIVLDGGSSLSVVDHNATCLLEKVLKELRRLNFMMQCVFGEETDDDDDY